MSYGFEVFNAVCNADEKSAAIAKLSDAELLALHDHVALDGVDSIGGDVLGTVIVEMSNRWIASARNPQPSSV